MRWCGVAGLRRFLAQALVEIRDRRVQHARDLIETTRRDAIDAALVFVRLLVGDTDHLGQLLLGQPQHDAPFADARADMVVDRCRRAASLWLCHFTHPQLLRPDRAFLRYAR